MDKELIEKLIAKINDKLAKVVMQMPESAIEYVSAFLPEIAESLDLEDMVLQNSNFLDKHLGEYFCDAIYETHLKQESGEEEKTKSVLFYFLNIKRALIVILTYFCSCWATLFYCGKKIEPRVYRRRLYYLWFFIKAQIH